MGIDMKNAMIEATDAFSVSNYQDRSQQEYLAAAMQLGEAAKAKDKEKSIEANLRMLQLEFDLYPHRYGPKGKQQVFRKKYLDYRRQNLIEMFEKGDYFSSFANSEGIALSQGLHFTMVDGKMNYNFDDRFIAYIEYSEQTIRNAIEKSKFYNSLQLHPEGSVVQNTGLMYSNAMANMMSIYHEETAKKIISHFKLDYDYIEIDPVNISKMECCVCQSEINVPENSNTVICETCGNSNNVKEKTINCINCGTRFAVSNGKAQCPSCGSVFYSIQNMNDVVSAQITSQENAQVKTKKNSSFFKRLFGG